MLDLPGSQLKMLRGCSSLFSGHPFLSCPAEDKLWSLHRVKCVWTLCWSEKRAVICARTEERGRNLGQSQGLPRETTRGRCEWFNRKHREQRCSLRAARDGKVSKSSCRGAEGHGLGDSLGCPSPALSMSSRRFGLRRSWRGSHTAPAPPNQGWFAVPVPAPERGESPAMGSWKGHPARGHGYLGGLMANLSLLPNTSSPRMDKHTEECCASLGECQDLSELCSGRRKHQHSGVKSWWTNTSVFLNPAQLAQ